MRSCQIPVTVARFGVPFQKKYFGFSRSTECKASAVCSGNKTLTGFPVFVYGERGNIRYSQPRVTHRQNERLNSLIHFVGLGRLQDLLHLIFRKGKRRALLYLRGR